MAVMLVIVVEQPVPVSRTSTSTWTRLPFDADPLLGGSNQGATSMASAGTRVGEAEGAVVS